MSSRNFTTTMSFLLLVVLFLLNMITSNGSPIKTIVVLVMENRSFDHMLGWMKELNPEINGVNGTEFNRINASDPNSKKIVFNKTSHYVDPDPGHSFQAIREQVFGSNDTSANPPPMNGFAQQAFSMDPSMNMSQDVMNGFAPDQVAVYKALVSEFAVFDRWFASLPTSTQPNRLYVHSATSHGLLSNVGKILAKGMPQRTIFDNLNDNGISWGVYFQQAPTTLFYSNLRKLKYITKFHQFDLTFKDHARKGNLPGYTVIEPRYFDLKIQAANDDHPSHDVYQGQMFVKDVYETLRASPQWNETMLVITYDEHGGFYDHVPTPVNVVPNPDDVPAPDEFNFKFDRLGVRVPTIVVSPWIEKGTVVHGPNGVPTATSEYEHSSIPATVKKLFNLTSPFLTKRDAWAGTFEGIFQKRTEPRTDCPEQLPIPLKIRESEANEEAKLTEFQQEVVELIGGLTGEFSQSFSEMTVKEAKSFIDNSLNRFFEAGLKAKEMGVDGEHIVQMRPSLTTRSSSTPSNVHV